MKFSMLFRENYTILNLCLDTYDEFESFCKHRDTLEWAVLVNSDTGEVVNTFSKKD